MQALSRKGLENLFAEGSWEPFRGRVRKMTVRKDLERNYSSVLSNAAHYILSIEDYLPNANDEWLIIIVICPSLSTHCRTELGD